MENHAVLTRTEQLSDDLAPIDRLAPKAALERMLQGQIAALEALRTCLDEIEAAADMMAETLAAGGALIYVAAGSSGLMALADGSELPGTFGVAQGQIRIAMAGGVPVDGAMPGATEDDVAGVGAVIDALQPGDLVIALSASGTTPWPCEIAARAKARGNRVVVIANNPGTRLLALGDVGICAQTPPEVLAGSTRLGAGTAQKVALNMMSTRAGVLLGHVHEGLMVNLHVDNAKLRGRANRIVAQLAKVDGAAAERALETADGRTKLAVLVALGRDRETAERALREHRGRLDLAIAEINETVNQTKDRERLT